MKLRISFNLPAFQAFLATVAMLAAHMFHLPILKSLVQTQKFENFDPTHHSLLAVNGHAADTAVKHLIRWIIGFWRQSHLQLSFKFNKQL